MAKLSRRRQLIIELSAQKQALEEQVAELQAELQRSARRERAALRKAAAPDGE